MAAISEINVLVIDLISLLITFPGYMFILVVNIVDWMKKKRLDISDQLISGISLCILTHRLQNVISGPLIFKYGHHIRHSLPWIRYVYFSVIFCTLLFSTSLAIHFCLKIVNINHKVYIYIQRKFPKMFPWILLQAVFFSVLISAPILLPITEELFLNSTPSAHYPIFSTVKSLPYFAFSFLCLLLFFSSTLNIILSLRRHIKHMNNSIAVSGEIVKAHVTAMKTVIALLAFNLFYFGLLIFLTVGYVHGVETHLYSCFYVLCHILGIPILIQGSSKLRKKLHAIWLSFSFSERTFTRRSAV